METNLPLQKLKQTILFILLLFFLSITNGFGQSFPPANTSCSSSDLSVVAAQLSGGDICNSCETAVSITRTLVLSINNTTGSTRTSFAFWGNLEIYSGTTGLLISSTVRTGCGGPLPPNSITSLSFGDVTYNCGDIIKISNIWEAWTSSSPNETCPLDPNNISPKCGKIPSITVNAGVNGEFALTQSQCGSATGAIDLTPTGGTPSYTYLWTASNGGVVPSGQQNNQDLTNLLPGNYSVQIKDANNCTTTITREIIQTNPTPNAVATPASQTICSASAITTMVLSGNVTGTTFNWTRNNTGTVTGIAASGSGNISGSLTNTTNAPVTVTFTITPTANSCTGTPITATVTVNPIPAVTNSATASICSGTGPNITLTSSISSSFAWTIGTITGGITGASAGSGSTINQTLTNPSNATAGTVQYLVTPTATTGSCAGA
ncbi:PKD-like domain-containing protein, partial [Flavobacterium undicola]|uniref:PKD-like domain-containing protein n=1 Tax=Flavobacterium undicola TaxID=1932779 RepID=UPI00293BB1C0